MYGVYNLSSTNCPVEAQLLIPTILKIYQVLLHIEGTMIWWTGLSRIPYNKYDDKFNTILFIVLLVTLPLVMPQNSSTIEKNQ